MEFLTRFYKSRLLPAGLLAGTIIGAGIFSLPFVFAGAGLGAGFFYLLIGTLAYITIHLMYADVILRTPGEHRFVGYAKIYLGRGAFWLSIAMTVVQMVFVLTIYLILSASFSRLIAPGLSPISALLLFWILSSLAIYISIRKLALLEFFVTGGIVAIIIAIFFSGLLNSNFTLNANWLFSGRNIFLPLAPILFALSGRVAIPALVDYFRGQHHAPSPSLLRQAIITGTVVPALVYGIFVLGVIGLSLQVSPDTVSGLTGASPGILMAIGLLGLISIWSSYIMIGLDVENIMRHDLRWRFLPRTLFVLGGPLLIYFSGFQNFLGLVEFIGGIFLSLEGILVVVLWYRANRVLGTRPILLKKSKLGTTVIVTAVFLLAFAAVIGILPK